ncbi:MAG: hypothetical protein WC455_29925 [Dehalococcoidia bacterium]|jgi:hypothetical protein
MTITATRYKDTAIEAIGELKALFVDDNKKQLEFTETQDEMVNNIVLMPYNRNSTITPTQYGKSTATGCGIIIKGVLAARRQVIIAGTEEKCQIIMGQVNQHVFDSTIFSSQLDIAGASIERLRRQRRRDHLTFKRGGHIKILSAQNRNKKAIEQALLGEGGQDIYLDDSPLMSNDQYDMILRMLGGYKDNFLFELGNAINHNHFYKTMHDKDTHKIWIDCEEAIREGRFTPEYIAEMEEKMGPSLFRSMYKCTFPREGEIDAEGYQYLLTEKEVDDAVASVSIGKDKDNRLGVDVGRGGNRTVLCLRNGYNAKVIKAEQTASIMATPALAIEAMQEYDIKAPNIAIDDTGLGGGATDRLREQKYYVTAVVLGSTKVDKIPDSKIQYKNIRAQCFWELKDWIKHGGRIEYNEALVEQLKLVKYRIDSGGTIQIQPKEDMDLPSGESPDEADALSLTFAPVRPEPVFAHDKKRNTTSYKNGGW